MDMFEKMIKNGKECGVEYEFIDNDNLKDCKCGGKPKIYITHTSKKYSFEHGCIRCPRCNESEDFVFDISGHESDFYKNKETAVKYAIIKWNTKQKLEGEKTRDLVFAKANMPVAVAAEALNVDCQTVRLLLQNNLVDWGLAYKRNNSTQYSYLIYPKKFYEETGFYYSGEE